MKGFWLCFVPLFVAVDAIGVLPMFLNLTHGVERIRRRRIVFQSVLTAAVVALVFMAMGKVILVYMGITIADFMVAGGGLLFVISLSDLLSGEKRQRRVDPESLGAVPIGVPLIVGPAVLTTTLLLVDEHGLVNTAGATLANVLFAGLVFGSADFFVRVLGNSGTRIVSKIASLLMAAIAVMMVRKGIVLLLASGG